MSLKPWDIIAELESDNSRLFKEEVIQRESLAGNEELFNGFKAAYDAMVTFGIKKVEAKTGDGKGINPQTFWDIAKKLMARELTGNAAITAVNHLRLNAKEDEWNYWYRRILIKDMRCGVSESTINKNVDPKYAIPVFECQLAHDGAKHESKIKGRKLIEVKLDGVRIIVVAYPSGIVSVYSRNGKELVNFPHIEKQISKHAVFFKEPMVLDGEVMSSSFQDLMKQVHRKSNVESSDAVLHLFDMLTLEEFHSGISEIPQDVRSRALLSWYTPIAEHMPHVQILGQELVDLDSPDGLQRFSDINSDTIRNGYEGIMIKDPEAPYECKRTVSWLKQKPFIDVTLTAVDIEEGKDGMFEGMMGAVVFEGEDDGKFIRVSCGGGWSIQDRAQIWATHTGKPVSWEKRVKGIVTTIVEQPGASIVGMLGEVRGDALTLSQDSDDVYSLRFPRFKVWRGFEKGEKL